MPEKKKTKSKLQWPRWNSPYQPGSNIYTFFHAMLKKGGMTAKEFKRKCKDTGAKPNFILRTVRKGFSQKGWTWEFNDSQDRYRITNLKDVRKIHKK